MGDRIRDGEVDWYTRNRRRDLCIVIRFVLFFRGEHPSIVRRIDCASDCRAALGAMVMEASTSNGSVNGEASSAAASADLEE